mmetsp:Transcript_4722/g.9543  ORF Transcript_4722/g.9543 Transcript_4722/m.9543 type:complete len:92 (+) Transcript_4722:1203-1478(+)
MLTRYPAAGKLKRLYLVSNRYELPSKFNSLNLAAFSLSLSLSPSRTLTRIPHNTLHPFYPLPSLSFLLQHILQNQDLIPFRRLNLISRKRE